MNPLADVLPPIVRKYVYAVLFLASIGFSVYQASDGDWGEFAAGVVAALVGLLATSNTATGEHRA